jgi:hypothetical protein
LAPLTGGQGFKYFVGLHFHIVLANVLISKY